MSENFSSWTRDEFLAFILIEASYADKLIQEDEKWVIAKIVSIERFYQLLEFYRNNLAEENKNVILVLKDKFYTTKGEREELKEKINGLFMADGQFSQIEKDLAKAFDKLFE